LGKVRVVTDSSAHFVDPGVIDRYQIAVLPLEIHFGSQRFKEGIDIDADGFFHRVSHGGPQPVVVDPPPTEIAEIYARLGRESDQIISIHRSRQLGPTLQNATTAARTLLGRYDIALIDSLTTSAGLGIIVEEAARAAYQGESLDSVVRIVRGIVPRIYSVFYVETLDYLQHNRLLGEAQAILGTMLGIKPFLTIEDGELVPMEKVRTRPQAIDRLVEFVTEFSSVERMIILQNTPYPTEQTRMLQERLMFEYPDREFPCMMYGPSLAAQIGPDGMGVVVYEGDAGLGDVDDLGDLDEF
jgi:DegV family protein with EDD domain